jgi:hypothetical protein
MERRTSAAAARGMQPRKWDTAQEEKEMAREGRAHGAGSLRASVAQ